MNLKEYQREATKTLLTGLTEEKKLEIVLLGLCGEIGSLASIYKRAKRDSLEIKEYKESLLEELGDALWYTAALAFLNNIELNDDFINQEDASTTENDLEVIYKLLQISVEILKERGNLRKKDFLKERIKKILKIIFFILKKNKLNKEELFSDNLAKNKSRWEDPRDEGYFRDKDSPRYQRLPRKAEIKFIKSTDNKILMQMNDMNLGDLVDDNNESPDYYRFHDVFHWSYVTFLGWSPVLRSLLKVKRKNSSTTDKNEDGARAIIREEAISLQIFNYAKRNDFLEGMVRIEYDMLKFVRNLTSELEVKDVGFKEWENTIMEGFRIFRELRDAYQEVEKDKQSGVIGVLSIDAEKRTMEFTKEVNDILPKNKQSL